ncbi:MAG TPA: NlpC/P60 family protein [Mycobacteriales bacterium]|nr:NlpC/P60 family protein [Mycobacteriales bacterium]
MSQRSRARHAKPSRLRTVTLTAGLSTAVAVPLFGLTAAPAAAHPAPSVTALPAAAPATAQPTLRQGSRGAAVTELQRRLGGLAADGVFGPRTRSAVVAFQSSRGLAADGVVGPRTWAALGSAGTAPRASRDGGRTSPAGSSVGAAAVSEASRHAGKPYRYGATGPGSFDCSGFVQYVYGRVGVALPRTSGQQAAAARPVARGAEQPGDLIIFRSGGTVTHVGIYAGNGTMWVARRSGTSVAQQKIWTSSYSVGRVA